MRPEDAFCGNCGRVAQAPPVTQAPEMETAEISAPAGPLVPESELIEASVTGVLDPLFNARYARQVARRLGFYSFFAAVIDFVAFLLNLFIALIHGGFVLLFFVPVFVVLSIIVVVVLIFVLPVPALLGEWHRLLTFRGTEASSTLQYIQDALDRHHSPRDSLSRKPITPPGEGRKLYLELRCGFFAGYVSCFPHGDDLYVGWTFWIYLSPLRAIIMKLGRKVQDYTGRGGDIYQTFRFESTRATINALHACTMEGINRAMARASSPPDGSPQAAAPAPWPADPAPQPSAAPPLTPSPAPAVPVRVPSAG
jgi:hypothetical protein